MANEEQHPSPMQEEHSSQMNEQLRILKEEEVDAWNKWREDNPDVENDLINLSDADISEVGITDALLLIDNLRSGANLEEANLSNNNFNGEDLSKTNLTNTNLTRIQALGTNFESATLTGACIEDWHINSETNFENVICEYIYLKRDKQERRPSDPNRNFAPGEFAKLVEKYISTVDLIFTEGIDWKAFLSSYQDIQVEYGEQNVSIQAIERKSGGAFVVRIEVSADAIKAEVEASFWQQYNPLLEAKDREIQWLYEQKEFYIEEIKNKREEIKQQRLENTELTTIIKTMAEKDNTNYDLRGANFGGGFAGKDYTGDVIHNYASEEKQTLAEAAEEIQKLLQQLKENNPDATVEQQQAYVDAAMPTTLKDRLVSALKAAGDTAIEEFLQRPGVKVVASGVKGWMLPD